MASSLNRAQLIGHVGQAPEFRTLSGGSEMCKLTLATSVYIKSKKAGGQFDQVTHWHTIIIYNKFAIEAIKKHVQKGAKLYVEGEINYRQYEDNHKIKRTFTEIVVTDYKGQVVVLDKKEKAINEESLVVEEDVGHDDMPF